MLIKDLDDNLKPIPPEPRRVLDDSYTQTMRACLRLCLEGKANEANAIGNYPANNARTVQKDRRNLYSMERKP